MQAFTLIYKPFPAECAGAVHGILSAAGGRVRIVIDSNQDEQTQRHALRHELAHLALNHLDDARSIARSIEEIEAEADAYADRMTDSEFAELMKGARL